MRFLSRGQVVGATAPALDIYLGADGRLADAASVEFTIWKMSPTGGSQVYPVTPVRHAAARVSLGRYAAPWTAPGLSSDDGLYEVRWYWTQTAGEDELTARAPFEIVEWASTPTGYCGISDVRAAGVVAAVHDDYAVQAAIGRATEAFDGYTGRSFFLRRRTIDLDGTGSRLMPLPDPAIALESIYESWEPGVFDTEPVDLSKVSFGGPRSPTIERLASYDGWLRRRLQEVPELHGRWPRGRKNIKVTAIWGYAEPSQQSGDLPFGDLPPLVRQGVLRLTLAGLGGIAASVADGGGGPLLKLVTRDQEENFAPTATGMMGPTGDLELNRIVGMYRRPPRTVVLA